MGWFGKILGGAIGLVIGGPVGLAIGAGVGHAVDKGAEEENERKENNISEYKAGIPNKYCCDNSYTRDDIDYEAIAAEEDYYRRLGDGELEYWEVEDEFGRSPQSFCYEQTYSDHCEGTALVSVDNDLVEDWEIGDGVVEDWEIGDESDLAQWYDHWGDEDEGNPYKRG